MVHYQKIHCPHCEGTDLQKNGHSPDGTQRWFCKGCKKYFRLDYRYNACKKGVKEKIFEMTLNSSGVRDIGRVYMTMSLECILKLSITKRVHMETNNQTI